jgi:hypothetical protein
MTYIKDTTDKQTIVIPAPTAVQVASTYTLALYSSAKAAGVSLSAKREESRCSLFYFVTIALPEGFPKGEYVYELKRGGKVLAEGVARIGEVDENRKDKEFKRGGVTFYEVNV